MRRYISLLLVVIFSLAIILVSGKSELGLIIKFLVGKLTYSTSNAAVLYFLCIFTLGIIILSLKLPVTSISNIAVVALPVCIFAGFLLNCLATFYYLYHFELPFGPYFLHWRDGMNSFTSPFHSHLGKVAIDFMARNISYKNTAGSYDMGTVFNGVIADAYAFSLGMCFLLANVAILSALPCINQRYNTHPVLPLLYLGSGIAILKNILDGGLFTQPAPVMCVMMCYLTLAYSTDDLQSNLKRYGWQGLIAILILELPVIIFSDNSHFPNFSELLFAICLLTLILSLTLKDKFGRLAKLSSIYLLIATGVDIYYNLLPLLKIPDKKSQIYAVETALSLPFSEKSSLYKIYAQLNDSANKPSWLLIANPMPIGTHQLIYFIRPISMGGQTGTFKLPASFMNFRIKKLAKKPGWLAIYVNVINGLPPATEYGIGNVISHNNAYVYTHAIARMLTNGGITEFIMMPASLANPIPDEFFLK